MIDEFLTKVADRIKEGFFAVFNLD